MAYGGVTPLIGQDAREKKRCALEMYSALKSERQSGWDVDYRDMASLMLPRSSRFIASDRNRNSSKMNRIIDSTATRALRTLSAGMMSGMTSPARPWFVLRTPDEDLNKSHNVKVWLKQVTDLVQRVFSKSNTYNALHTLYRELGIFGTGCNFVSPNFDRVIHNYTATAGEYVLATDDSMMVNTIYREFEMTINQAVRQFGYDKLSMSQQVLFDTRKGNVPITIVHAVEPRLDRDPSKRDNKNMPWRSLYIEHGGEDDRILEESGFKHFPAMCPRWDVTSNDTYGGSPGMDALGDVRQLQQEQFCKAEAIDYKARPPLQAPTSMKERDSDFLPGGISFYDQSGPNQGIRTAFDVNLDINELREDIQDVRERINSAFYVDIFLMLTNSQDPKMTATEVAERHEEKMLMLGPVLERLHNELLSPLIDAAFARVIETGMAPPPPPELAGLDLQIEYVSVLAQAQRAIAINGVDRFVGNLGAIAQIKPTILDRFDADAWVDIYADALGVDPNLIVAMETAAYVRQQRAQQQQAQDAMASAASIAKTSKDAAQAAQAAPDANQMADPTANLPGVPPGASIGGGGNGLDISNLFSGYGSPTGAGL